MNIGVPCHDQIIVSKNGAIVADRKFITVTVYDGLLDYGYYEVPRSFHRLVLHTIGYGRMVQYRKELAYMHPDSRCISDKIQR